jgi:hypothetical protein
VKQEEDLCGGKSWREYDSELPTAVLCTKIRQYRKMSSDLFYIVRMGLETRKQKTKKKKVL